MKLKSTAVAVFGLLAALSAQAAEVDYGSFKVNYDASTVFGSPTLSFSSSGNVVGFGWTVPTDVQVVSLGSLVTASFDLPSFTITANSGWALSGGVNGFLGNLVYNELGGSTAASVTGSVVVDGSPAFPFGGALDKVVVSSTGGLSTGYYSGSYSAPVGAFNSFSFSGGSLSLQASGGLFSSIIGQPQNELRVSLVAMPVPEPETYAMLLAGLGVMALLFSRRRQNS